MADGRAFLAAALLAAGAAQAQLPPAPEGGERLDRQEAGCRATLSRGNRESHATDAAYAMLARGGSAVDAAVAAQLVLGLTEPQSSGLGGGAFVLVHSARTHKLHAYDGRETAPAAAKPDRFLDAGGAPRAFRDVVATGPRRRRAGTLRVLELAHARHGKLPWGDLFAPAIALAEAGFDVSPRLAGAIAGDANLARDPRASKYFFGADGKPLVAGSTLRNPAYAATLRTIAREGAGALYRGAIADDIVATVAANATRPGDLTLADLEGYRAIERPPLCGMYRRYRVCGFPPPSSGATTVLAILGLLEPYDIASMGPNSFWSVHFLSEAGRLAYADRARYVGDPAFVDVPAGIVDAGYLRERSMQIRTTSSLGAPPPANRRGASTSARSRRPLPRRWSRPRRRMCRSSMSTATRSR
jgi:gamma-glutamyltranspeptidase/glutathione hydrolase